MTVILLEKGREWNQHLHIKNCLDVWQPLSGRKVEKVSIEGINPCHWEVRMKRLLSVLVMVFTICTLAKAEEVTKLISTED